MKMIKKEFEKSVVLIGAILTLMLFVSLRSEAQDESTTETTVQTETRTRTSETDRVPSPTRARAGIKGGLNLSNLINDEVTNNDAKVGFHAGVYGQLFVNEGFAVQPELNFSTKGNRVTTNYGIIDQETKFNLSYL
ncbi:MAG: hypothetical protein C0490_23590, partial [Marivirga sp.]|nr:hypothetical protein [Marivirga sp.]